jgi:hypothetical protein
MASFLEGRVTQHFNIRICISIFVFDVDTIMVDVNDDMCDIFTENYNVEEMPTEPMPESEDTSTAANHSFPANTSSNSETRRKTKSGKSQHFLSCWH